MKLKAITLFVLAMLPLAACNSTPSAPVRPVDWNGTSTEVYTRTGTPWDLLHGKADEQQAARYIRAMVDMNEYEEVNGARGGNRSTKRRRTDLNREVNQAYREWNKRQNQIRKNFQGRKASIAGTLFWSENDLTTSDAVSEIIKFEIAANNSALVNPTTAPTSGSGAVQTKPINSQNPTTVTNTPVVEKK